MDLERLKTHRIYVTNIKVQKYLQKMWFKCQRRWVKALRNPAFESSITTTNGVESLNKLMKHKFFTMAEDKRVTSIVKCIVER
jgi:hypothetical protein